MSENRQDKRKAQRQIENIVAKAKVDMNKWILQPRQAQYNS